MPTSARLTRYLRNPLPKPSSIYPYDMKRYDFAIEGKWMPTRTVGQLDHIDSQFFGN